jgi:hypothetical protein
MKTCSKCIKQKSESEFYNRKDSKDGLMGRCKECVLGKSKEYCAKYYKLNRNRLLTNAKSREMGKRDMNTKRRTIKKLLCECSVVENVCSKCLNIKNMCEFGKDSSRNNGLTAWCKSCKNEYRIKRRKIDHLFRLSTNIRSMISTCIKSNGLVKKKSTEKIIGCSFLELRMYIEDKFLDGMSWENYGKWHMDHIVPISYAMCEDELYELNHYSNFQPLWSIDNLSKGNRFIG